MIIVRANPGLSLYSSRYFSKYLLSTSFDHVPLCFAVTLSSTSPNTIDIDPSWIGRFWGSGYPDSTQNGPRRGAPSISPVTGMWRELISLIPHSRHNPQYLGEVDESMANCFHTILWILYYLYDVLRMAYFSALCISPLQHKSSLLLSLDFIFHTWILLILTLLSEGTDNDR